MNRKGAVFIAMGFEVVGLVTGLVLLGRYFDTTYGWGGLGAGIGAFVGVMAWVIHMIQILKSLANKPE